MRFCSKGAKGWLVTTSFWLEEAGAWSLEEGTDSVWVIELFSIAVGDEDAEDCMNKELQTFPHFITQ